MESRKPTAEKDFVKQIRKISRNNKRVADQITSAFGQVDLLGKTSLPQTKHGESRIKNAVKYDLADHYRLVTIESEGNIHFLFAGTHDETEKFLDNKRGLSFVKHKETNKVQTIVPPRKKEEYSSFGSILDANISDCYAETKVLKAFSIKDFDGFDFDVATINELLNISIDEFDLNREKLFEEYSQKLSDQLFSLIWDILEYSRNNNVESAKLRIDLEKENAEVVSLSEAKKHFSEKENSETYIFIEESEDLKKVFFESDISDWMLFLHEEQKKLVHQDFQMPARLRGVSGSGKTSVLVHRARRLAKINPSHRVLLLTLTESNRRMLEVLLNDLCGLERGNIDVFTFSRFCKDLINGKVRINRILDDPEIQDIIRNIIKKNFPGGIEIPGLVGASYDSPKLIAFLFEEFKYIKQRLTREEYKTYEDSKTFPRKGRGVGLKTESRKLVLDLLDAYDSRISDLGIDYEGIGQSAFELSKMKPLDYRYVLVDEVQDLSEMELRILSNMGLRDHSGFNKLSSLENGLFLVGDGAQTIYKKGFSFKRIGINTKGNNFVFHKNYRNTYEILKASYQLIVNMEFNEIDEEALKAPDKPEFNSIHGERPKAIICQNEDDEIKFIVNSIKEYRELGIQAGRICVVGLNKRLRDKINNSLAVEEIKSDDLKNDGSYHSSTVKISTIEGAKGHDFQIVYITSLTDQILPGAMTGSEDEKLQVSRLYVAMTRAKEFLYLLTTSNRNNTPSRFLSSIQDHIDQLKFNGGELKPVKD